MSDMSKHFYRASAENFAKIPGSPIAYWVSEQMISTFDNENVGDITISDGQTKTGDNDKYLRLIWEIPSSQVGKDQKWVKHPKGGSFRRWYGNLDCVIDWSESSRIHYRKDRVARILPDYLWWKKGFCWTLITSGSQSFRIVNDDEIFNLAAPTLFPKNEDELGYLLCLVNTPVSSFIANLMNPTLNMNVGEIQSIPLIDVDKFKVSEFSVKLIGLSKSDWDSFETSWNFQSLPLITNKESNTTLVETYTTLRSQWLESTQEMQRLEEENNRIFIDAYGLQDELTPEVSLNEITLSCNPHYRYGGDKTEEQLEGLLQQDTIKELISYAVGCMFGRYSLDKSGLILANAGETLEDYLKQVPQPTFEPDNDNVIPIMDVDWFDDDIAERFKTFLKVTFGEDNYEENFRFVEDSLGYKTTGKGKGQSIRDYFLKDFYTDHWKRYKKRPIYWMFSSPKGTFNALIYMHRYRPDTVSTVLNEYLREFSQKLTAHRDNKKQESLTAEGKLKIALEKEITTLGKQIEELADYERDLFELVSKSREELTIDLDDGVKVNYPKFGGVLKKIPGLSQ